MYTIIILFFIFTFFFPIAVLLSATAVFFINIKFQIINGKLTKFLHLSSFSQDSIKSILKAQDKHKKYHLKLITLLFCAFRLF